MNRTFRFALTLLIFFLPAVSALCAVGEWLSIGPVIDVKKLIILDNEVLGGTDGGVLSVNRSDFSYRIHTNIHYPDHVKISALNKDENGHLWLGYDHSPAPVTCRMNNGEIRSFDFGFDQILSVSSRGNDVIVAYKKGLSYGLAHFITTSGYVAFKDTYENFPEEVGDIHATGITDSLILFSSGAALLAGDLYASNLKPASQWRVILDRRVDVINYENDTLYVAYSRSTQRRIENQWLSPRSYPGYTPRGFFKINNQRVLADKWGVYADDGNQWTLIYSSPRELNDVTATGDTLIFAEKDRGITFFHKESKSRSRIMPNSPFASYYNTVEVDNDGKVYFANRDGISIFNPQENHWHNIIRADTSLSIHENRPVNSFSADTLAYTVIPSTGTKVYDMVLAQNGYIYISFEGFYVKYHHLYYDPVVKPGPLLLINKNNYYDYTMVDTTDDVFHGSEASVGGEVSYLVLRGMTETNDGSIWVLNAHAANYEPLVRFKPDGDIEKYSVSESGDVLELLPTEITTDAYNRIWIGLQSHPQNEPVTTGGIAVYDTRRDLWYRITTGQGLVNNNVLSIDTAPNGTIWVVTSGGIQSINPPVSVTRFMEDIVSNISSPLPAVSDANITKVQVDGRNNKWFLTSDGGVRVYLSNSTWLNSGYGFNSSNSPILDPFVSDVAFDAKSGNAYITTVAGINVIETPWAEEIKNVSEIKMYPQPYDASIHDRFIIDGLPDQSTAKIVTLGGEVLCTIGTDSPFHFGRQIIWDGILDNGDTISRGVYYLFVYNVKGKNRTLKFAVK